MRALHSVNRTRARANIFANSSRSLFEPDPFSACLLDYSCVYGEARSIDLGLPLTSKNRVLPKREKVHYQQYKNKAETDMGDRMRKVIGVPSHLSGVLLATCRTHRGALEPMTHTSCLAQGSRQLGSRDWSSEAVSRAASPPAPCDRLVVTV